MKQLILLLAPMAILAFGCQSGGAGSEQPADLDSLLMDATGPDHTELSDELVGEIMETMPSPLEFTSLIKSTGASYSERHLNSPDRLDNYTTSFQKSVNLGIYGADLGYINLYGKTSSAFSHLNAVRDLANDLKVGQFFDFTTMKRLADNKHNLDSILFISTQGFEKVDSYLNEHNRSNVSLLILYGGWLEALHLAMEANSQADLHAPELRERIGEQKIVLDDLLLLLSVYKSQPQFGELIADLEALKAAYSEVNISYTYEQPKLVEVDGRLEMQDNRTSTVEISDAAYSKIQQVIATLRNRVIA